MKTKKLWLASVLVAVGLISAGCGGGGGSSSSVVNNGSNSNTPSTGTTSPVKPSSSNGQNQDAPKEGFSTVTNLTIDGQSFNEVYTAASDTPPPPPVIRRQ